MLIEVVGPPVRHRGVRYAAGQRIEVPDVLALAFISQSRAKRVEVEPKRQPPASPAPSTLNHKRR